MKLTIFVFLMVLGAIACQTPNVIEGCVIELKNDKTIVESLLVQLKTKNILSIVALISSSQTAINATKEACKKVTKEDIMGFVYGKLNEDQKNCLANVMGTIMSVTSLQQYVKERQWNDLIASIKTVTENAQNAKDACAGKF